ncbi:MAG: hypothetical protein M1608_03390 [Candidatus Omnitrophica bacterium]|nr:hypothetical protein [Candidatus Omnitrophota bacterium]
MYRPSLVHRFQLAVLLAAAGLTLFNFVVFQPLSRHADVLDKSLSDYWKKLVDINLKNRAKLGMSSWAMQQSRLHEEKTVSALQEACQQARERIQLDPEIRERLRQLSFQLIDFNQISLQMRSDLQHLAAANKVALDPAAMAGFPEYLPGKEKPALLWAQLAIVNSILTTAVAAKPASIKSVSLLPSRTHYSTDGTQATLEEFPVGIELSGSMQSVMDLLVSLPLKAAELKQLHFAEAPTNKPSLFLDRFILKKSPSGPSDVSLVAVISGFLAYELSP